MNDKIKGLQTSLEMITLADLQDMTFSEWEHIEAMMYIIMKKMEEEL